MLVLIVSIAETPPALIAKVVLPAKAAATAKEKIVADSVASTATSPLLATDASSISDVTLLLMVF